MYYWQNDICERAIFLFIRNMWKSLPAEPGSFPIHSSSIHPAIRIMPPASLMLAAGGLRVIPIAASVGVEWENGSRRERKWSARGSDL